VLFRSAALASSSTLGPRAYNPDLDTKILILLHGYETQSQDFTSLGQAIQGASQERLNLCIGIPENFDDTQDAVYVKSKIDESINECRFELKEHWESVDQIYIGIYSENADFLAQAAQEYSGVLMLGSLLDYGSLKSWNTPILHLGGEFDIFSTQSDFVYQIYIDYTKLNNLEKQIKPTIMLPGVTHSQFSSRKDPVDIEYVVPLEQAQTRIASVVVAFLGLDYTFVDSVLCTTVLCKPVQTDLDSDSNQFLNQKIAETSSLLDARFKLLLTTPDSICMESQYIVGNLESHPHFNHSIGNTNYKSMNQFYRANPTLKKTYTTWAWNRKEAKDKVAIGTFATSSYVAYDNPKDTPFDSVPHYIACKGVSAEHIAKQFDLFKPKSRISCKSLFEETIRKAEQALSESQMSVFKASGRPLVVGEDEYMRTEKNWLNSKLKFTIAKGSGDREVTKVHAIAYREGDYHYCKVMMPISVMEYMHTLAFLTQG